MGLDHLSPLWFAATRMGLGTLCLFVFLAAQGLLVWPGRREVGITVAIGVLQIGLPTALLHTGLVYVEAGRSAILVFTMSLWVAPMAYFVLDEKLTAMKVCGLALGLAGILTLFNPLTFPFSDRAMLTGNAFMLLASVCFAVAIVIIRRHRWTVPIVRVIPWQMLLGTVLLAFAAAAIEGRPDIRWSGALVAIMAYNGPIASAFCFWAYVSISRSLPAMSTAIGSLGVPVVGILSSSLMLDEGFGFSKIAGLVLISLGVAAVTIGDSIRGNPG
jgi:drug/metabolite transporter (DMT)-like permease